MINRSLTTRTSDHENELRYYQTKWFLMVVTILLTLVFSNNIYPILNDVSKSTSILSTNLGLITANASGYSQQQRLLILTPLKDAQPWLNEYFINLEKINYPKQLISLGFLISDTTDKTKIMLQNKAKQLSKLGVNDRYHSIEIFEKDFHFNLASQVRHGFEGQPVRRAFIARARNFLLTAALKYNHAWVLWLDVDVVRYDPNILSDLMSVNKDIVVPNTLWYQKDTWDFWVTVLPYSWRILYTNITSTQGFDRNNFAETEESLALLKQIGPDILLVEGTFSYTIHTF